MSGVSGAGAVTDMRPARKSASVFLAVSTSPEAIAVPMASNPSRPLAARAAGLVDSLMAENTFWAASRSRSEEHTSELQSLMRISYAVFCLKKKRITNEHTYNRQHHNNTTHKH